MANSILSDVKKLLGMAVDYTAFDQDVTIFINAALGTLNQLGVGPTDGMQITGVDETWDILAQNVSMTELCQSYVFLKTKMLFDPPTARFPIQAMEEQLTEMEWRIHANVDSTETLPIVEPVRPLTPAEQAYQTYEEEWWDLLP